MPVVETTTRKIVDRLESEGWQNIGGGKHDKFVHADRPGVHIAVPRHKEQSPGVARSVSPMVHYVGIIDGSDDVWGVRVPDFPGCHGGGATAEAAIED
eukprot:gene29075-32589_t